MLLRPNRGAATSFRLCVEPVGLKLSRNRGMSSLKGNLRLRLYSLGRHLDGNNIAENGKQKGENPKEEIIGNSAVEENKDVSGDQPIQLPPPSPLSSTPSSDGSIATHAKINEKAEQQEEKKDSQVNSLKDNIDPGPPLPVSQTLIGLTQSMQAMLNDKKHKLHQTFQPLTSIPWSKLANDPAQFIQGARKTLNGITGYAEIDRLKEDIERSSGQFEKSKEALAKAKNEYHHWIESRAQGQRDINNLLQRKHAWSEDDVVNFTKLYRQEHTNDQLERTSKELVQSREAEVARRYNDLVDAIRTRYHEEQLWSDKIRSVSSYWTLLLIMLNMVMFLSVHLLLEPRKRAKLVDNVQSKVHETWANERAVIEQKLDLIYAQFFDEEQMNSLLNKLLDRLETKFKPLDHEPNYPTPAIQTHDTHGQHDHLINLLNDLLTNPPPPPAEVTIPPTNANATKDSTNYFLIIGSALSGAILSTGISLLLSSR